MAIGKILFPLVFFVGLSALAAETITIPLEELPSESVIPALDSPRAVEKRLLSYRGRWVADVGTGWILDEPFYQNQYYGFRAMYNWNEVSGFGFRYMSWAKGLSDYGNQLRGSNSLDFGYGRGPEKGYALSYENRFIYGKLSVAKNVIIPISIQGQFEVGMIGYGTKNLPFLSAGVGNKVFFTSHFGMDLAVKYMLRQAMDPLSKNINTTTMTSAPSEGDFSVKTRISTGMDLNFIYIF